MRRYIIVLILLFHSLTSLPAWGETGLRIGIFSFRTKELTQSKWQPLEAYLEQALSQKVTMQFCTYEELNKAVAESAVDMVLTTPGHYIQLQLHNSLSAPLVTQISQEGNLQLAVYGTTIFTRADMPHISTLPDLAGKRLATTATDGIVHQIAVYEMLEAGLLMPNRNQLLVTGVPVEKVVEAVLAGRADAGFARSGTLEAMEREGKLDLGQIKVINPQNLSSYPYLVSTRLYPEWPVVLMPHVDSTLARKLAVALLSLPPGTIHGVHGFTTPANYQSVENLLRRLRVPPFDVVADFTLADFVKKYSGWIIALGLLGATLLITTMLLAAQNRRVKQGQQALRESEEKFRQLFVNMTAGFALHEMIYDDQGRPVDYRFIELNPAFERLTGARAEDLIGRTVKDVMPTTEQYWIDTYGQVAKTGEPVSFQNYSQEIGKYFDAFAFSPGENRFAVVFVDVTERKQAEMALRESESRIRNIFDAAGVYQWEINNDMVYTYVSGLSAQVKGYLPESLMGHTPMEFMPEEDIFPVGQIVKRAITEKTSFRLQHRNITPSGSVWWEEVYGAVFCDDQGAVIGLRGTGMNINERKQTEIALKHSHQLMQYVIEHTHSAIAVHDRDLRYLYVSQRYLLDYKVKETDIIGRHHYEVFPDLPQKWRDVHQKALAGEVLSADEDPYYRSDGSVEWTRWECRPWYEADGSIGGIIVYTEVITERKKAEDERLRLEQQLLHTQKLESLGILAGGIAHDFNNILTAIIGNAELALNRLKPESPVIDNLQRIEKAAARAADLAKQMLAYSGKGKFVVEQLDLNILLKEMLHMLEVSISKKAVLRLTPCHPLPLVEADATQLRQIIMNLVINASEAIGDKSGVIAISSGCMDCDRNYLKDAWLDENIAPGLYVYLEIADTGCGMDKETMAKLFDPFFTTKFTGRGLGMAAVLGIVRGHKGAIKVYSEQGKGTTFKILLPASGKPAERFNGDAGKRKNWQGSGTVLLVDDEETVRGIGSEMLKELGFSVITANDGRDALETFKQHPEISIVILDLTMPHMDGEQCFRELRLVKPEVKVVISSGFSESEVTHKFYGKGLGGFIQKPYKLSTLRDILCAAGDS